MDRSLNTASRASDSPEISGASGTFSADEVHGQCARIGDSAVFRDSLRLKCFLSFVVEMTLAGKCGRIKAYTIAVEALGRGADFDPQNDPIVRVEAGRLRQALSRYYAEEGRGDRIIIDLPRGSYVPTFQSRPCLPPPQIVRGDRSPASPSVASPTSPQPTGRALELANNIFGSVELLHTRHKQQMTVFLVELDSVRKTLRQSRDLLKLSGQLDSRERPAPPRPPTATEAAYAAGASDTGFPEEVLTASASGQPPQVKPEPPQTDEPTRRLAGPAAKPAPARIFKGAFVVIAVLALFEIAFDIDRPLVGGPNHGLLFRLWAASGTTTSEPQDGVGEPIFYVEPVTAIGERVSGTLSPAMVRERMIDALARFDDVTVVAADPREKALAAAVLEPRSKNEPSSDLYRLSFTIHYYPDGSLDVIVQAIDTTDNTLAWSKTYKHPVNLDPNRKKDRIVADVARTLLAPLGAIEARERIRHATADPMRDTYRCILDAESYLHSFDPSQYQPVHDCLLRASTELPPRVTVFADLAFLYLRSYRFGISSSPGDRALLDKARAMAARAVQIKPNSAFAQYALQEVLLAEGDIARAKIAGDNSFRLNPDDSRIIFGHASLLILTGQLDAGLPLLNEEAAKMPNGWIGYHVLMALGCYLKGNLAAAAAQSRQIANPYFPPGLVLDALVADKDGDLGRAQLDLAMLSQFYPSWQKNIGAAVGRFLPVPAMAQRIAADFQAATAGLPN